MGYLLDTNHWIWVLDRKKPALSKKIATLGPQEVAVSVITLSELHFGAAKSPRRAENEAKIEDLIASFPVIDLDYSKARAAGQIRAALKTNPIGPNDLLIAATALDAGLILVTNNVREFKRVPELVVEDWSR